MLGTSTHRTMNRHGCMTCGALTRPGAGLCSTHCRAEADLELRRNRALARELRRGLHVIAKHRLELRRLDDRNAELQEALVASVPHRWA